MNIAQPHAKPESGRLLILARFNDTSVFPAVDILDSSHFVRSTRSSP